MKLILKAFGADEEPDRMAAETDLKFQIKVQQDPNHLETETEL